jgi:uncharacterized membrane protein YqjE
MMCLGLWLAAIVGCGLLLRSRLRTIVLMVLALPLAAWGVYILFGLLLWLEPPRERLYSVVGGLIFVAASIAIGWWATRSWSKLDEVRRT